LRQQRPLGGSFRLRQGSGGQVRSRCDESTADANDERKSRYENGDTRH
jgi:hypothetical protein